MADQKPKQAMTRAEAAKLVVRMIPDLDENGKPKTNKAGEVIIRKQAINEAEVMSFSDYADRLVVVTTAGEKLVHYKAA